MSENVIAIISATGILGLLGWAVRYWIEKKEERRKKSVLVAELLAEWLSKPTDRKRLNQLTFESFLWLPGDIANKLSALLSWDDTEKVEVRDIIFEVRKLLRRCDKKFTDRNKIIVFPDKQN